MNPGLKGTIPTLLLCSQHFDVFLAVISSLLQTTNYPDGDTMCVVMSHSS